MISREEAIEKLKDMRDEAQGWNDSQPERPKGRYIPDNRYQTLGNCSLCNGYLTMLDNFCPKCGCDMRGEEE